MKPDIWYELSDLQGITYVSPDDLDAKIIKSGIGIKENIIV